jgi:hypothetical protein
MMHYPFMVDCYIDNHICKYMKVCLEQQQKMKDHDALVQLHAKKKKKG